MFTQPGDQVPKALRKDQLRWIGGDRSGRDQVQVGVIGMLNDFFSASLANQVIGHAHMVGQPKVVENFGFAQIHPNQHGLLAGEGENGSHVGGYEGLAFPGNRRSYQQDLLGATGVDVLHVSTQGPEGLRDDRFGMLQSHQGCVLVVVTYDPQNRNPGHGLDLLTVNQGVLQAVPNQDYRHRDQQTQQGTQGIIQSFVGGNLLLLFGCVDDPGIGKIGGHGDAGLGPLLEQINIEVFVEGEFAFDIHQITLGSGQGGQQAFGAANAGIQIPNHDLGILNQIAKVFADGRIGQTNLLVQLFQQGIGTPGPHGHGVAFGTHLAQFLDQTNQHRVLHPHGRWGYHFPGRPLLVEIGPEVIVVFEFALFQGPGFLVLFQPLKNDLALAGNIHRSVGRTKLLQPGFGGLQGIGDAR